MQQFNMQQFNNPVAASTEAATTHYEHAYDYMELWDGSDMEVRTERGVLVLAYDDDGEKLCIIGEFVWDDSNKVGDDEASGWGYIL